MASQKSNHPTQNKPPLISLSVVSHGQVREVKRMLQSLSAHSSAFPLEIILTENVRKNIPDLSELRGTNLRSKVNFRPQGFARNHNLALSKAQGKYIAIVNPNVVFVEDVFPTLIEDIEAGRGDIVAPLVVNHKGDVEDSFRDVPTPKLLILRRLFPKRYRPVEMPMSYVYPEWLAGIFLMMKTELYRTLGGLDEGYHLYFEDVDFGCRAHLAEYQLLLDHRCKIIHERTRANRANPRHLYWHTRSAVRFFNSKVYREWKQAMVSKAIQMP